MASSVTRRVPKIDDQTLVQVCKDIAVLFPDYSARVSFALVPGLAVSLEEVGDLSALAGRYAFDSASVAIDLRSGKSFHLSFSRSIKEGDKHVSSSRHDEFVLMFGGDVAHWKDEKDLIPKVTSVVSNLGLSSPPGAENADNDTLRELIIGFGSSHRHMLEALNNQIVEHEKKRDEVEAAFDRREEERLAKHKKAVDELEAERAKLQLQSYRSERRKIMQNIVNAEAAGLRKSLAPKGAIIARWAVFVTAILLSILAAGLAYTSIVELGVDDAVVQKIIEAAPAPADTDAIRQVLTSILGPTNWFLIGRSIISSIVAIGGLIYAAEWLRHFYSGEVSSAQEIDRFNYDLVRASWIIETILEVKHEHSGEVPHEWIEGVTRGLFDSARTSDALDEGAQALKALMGFTASASFGPDGPKFDIGRRDARKLAKTATEQ